MDAHQCFFGFEISADLYHSCVQTIKDIGVSHDADHLNRRVTENLIRLTDEGFVAYYAKPVGMVQMSNILRKAADTGVHTVQKGIHMVVRKIFSGTPVSQLKIMSDYMGQLLCTDGIETGRHYICFPLSEELFSLAQTLLARVRTDAEVNVYREDIIKALERLIQAGIDAYYAKPVSQVSLGKITRAASDIGIKTVQKGSNAVVHKVFNGMDHAEMLPLAAYFESLLHNAVYPFNQPQAA